MHLTLLKDGKNSEQVCHKWARDVAVQLLERYL